MARYIDADALKEQLEDFSKWCRDGRKQGVDFVLDCVLPNIATADVAPRSEVAREIFEEIEANINALEYNARTPRKTVSVDELKAQMDWVLREVIPGTLAKIKQKYTEE